ncbi:MAG: hypothetical protein ACXVZ2_15410 [Gaiellaceae bacterium]
MNTTSYIINIVLVLLVVRQVRGRRLDFQNLVLPVLLVAAAASYFLHSVPTVGNDVALDVALGLTGVALGSLGGLFTRFHADRDGTLVARAGLVSAVLWVTGIGARMVFAYAVGHGAGPAVAHFSRAHAISGADAWVAALVLMALAEVTARLVVVHARSRRLAPSFTGTAAAA